MAALVSSVAVAQAGKYVTVVESYPQPVIGRELAASFGVLGGFETGNIIKEDGAYHMFYGEKANPTTYPWKMGWTTGVGHWVSPAATGPWTRLETVLSLSRSLSLALSLSLSLCARACVSHARTHFLS